MSLLWLSIRAASCNGKTDFTFHQAALSSGTQTWEVERELARTNPTEGSFLPISNVSPLSKYSEMKKANSHTIFFQPVCKLTHEYHGLDYKKGTKHLGICFKLIK